MHPRKTKCNRTRKRRTCKRGGVRKRYYMTGCASRGSSRSASNRKRGGTYFDSHKLPTGGAADPRLYPNPGPPGPYPGQLNSSLGHNGGGLRQSGGNNGLPFGQNLPPMKSPPIFNDFVGKPWSASTYGGEYFSLNKYMPDVVTAIKDVGANVPFLGGGRARGRGTRKQQQRGGSEMFPLWTDLKGGINYTSYLSTQTANQLAGNSIKTVDPRPYIQPSLSRMTK